MRKRNFSPLTIILILIVTLTLALAGCKGESGNDSSASSSRTVDMTKFNKLANTRDLADKCSYNLDCMNARVKEGGEEYPAGAVFREAQEGVRKGFSIFADGVKLGKAIYEVEANGVEVDVECLDWYCGKKHEKEFDLSSFKEERVADYLFGRNEFDHLREADAAKERKEKIGKMATGIIGSVIMVPSKGSKSNIDPVGKKMRKDKSKAPKKATVKKKTARKKQKSQGQKK